MFRRSNKVTQFFLKNFTRKKQTLLQKQDTFLKKENDGYGTFKNMQHDKPKVSLRATRSLLNKKKKGPQQPRNGTKM
jgi:hypothetical protein